MKTIIKKVVALVMAAAIIAAVTACGGTSTQESTEQVTDAAVKQETSADAVETEVETTEAYEPEVKEVVFGIQADPQYWNPWGQFNQGRRNVIPIIYQTLIAQQPDVDEGTTHMCMVLAESYEQVSDSIYEVVIREGIYDTAGNSFTASDVIFNYESAKAQGNFAALNSIDSLEQVDDYTVRFHINSTLGVGDFEDILITIPMVTQKAFEDSGDGMTEMPVGTTGYVMTEYNAGSNVTFEATGNYWNAAANESKSYDDGYCPWWDCTKLDKIVVEFITDDSARAIALESGTIDIAASVTVTDAEIFQAAGTYTVGSRASNLFGLAFNASENSVSKNKNLRLALSHAVDSQGVLDLAFNGEGIVLKAWAYPTYFDYQASWDEDPYFEYDLDLAKEYLEKYYKETKTTASDLSLTFVVQTGSYQSKIAEAVQSYIVELTGNANCVNIESYDSATYEQVILDPTSFDILLMSSQAITRTYSTVNWSRQANAEKLQSGNDIWHSSNKEIQELVSKATSRSTHSDETVAAFQECVNENAYLKMLVCNSEFQAAQGWISGLDNCIGYKNSVAILALDYDWASSGK